MTSNQINTSVKQQNKYQIYKNYQVYQESILIKLLLPYCDIVFGKPSKKTTTTLQFLNIKELKFKNYSINITEYIERRCKEIIEMERRKGVKEKTSLRRYENNKFTECLHLLMDILSEFGYFFNTTKSQGKNGIAKSETIQQIFYKGFFMFSREQVELFGKNYHNSLIQSINENSNLVITNNSLWFH
ncbi:hypothetical protein EHI8A_212780 [Entamoeba histolytica HM-1:IMSS-B]|uniref:Uncharacterized protein n=6 Tax=Entamoeba histolytica TaxID=5759 RepID=C4LVS0_ENTH1|nr:hypothetical protein EHI_187030 [Entamoeba histolytica HM-1:IMSS]EMD43879.1 Hypothetical protein EHI5A_229490 [Entamoeba histolytica KU27]EMH76481.1 hypothetical protein EHI8A_212780 [Entamoeba histolytica HM-1:IMSS-B]EMS17966.1 hypothetical protein KM1_284540 [Entamoeba histolytica HM-3:IMSS]ENY60141.1 hypothetical protein EHI7A_183270 [Entamoeba histolytica HM-1:IMSS-A]GAT92775.1 hypothetical protein CL6EHI_187030 [Entamoeba histolytica]|eukprot:XP_656418.1 hypothetical protein EHI_187030 [Entamoeba histolytica HM-1:IMSS]